MRPVDLWYQKNDRSVRHDRSGGCQSIGLLNVDVDLDCKDPSEIFNGSVRDTCGFGRYRINQYLFENDLLLCFMNPLIHSPQWE
jgi:hypothetical protein